MKRFYKFVSLGETPKGFSILLDSKPVKTQARHMLTTPSRDLANAIMQEWLAQGDKILPSTMPLMQILATKIDRVSVDRAVMTAEIMKYLDTDLICYRTDQHPLAEPQKKSWDPWVEWFVGKFGIGLETTTGLKALRQPEKAHAAVLDYIESLDDDIFTILQIITPLSGSLVLALAFVEGAISADEIFAVMRVEENWKAEIYNEKFHGPDPAQEKKDAAIKVDLAAAEKFLYFLSENE